MFVFCIENNKQDGTRFQQEHSFFDILAFGNWSDCQILPNPDTNLQIDDWNNYNLSMWKCIQYLPWLVKYTIPWCAKKSWFTVQIWKRISFISHCGIFIFYQTWYNLHILPLMVNVMTLFTFYFFVVIISLPE